MQAPHVNSVCFESLPLKVLEFWQKISKPFLNTFSFPLIISNHLSLISKTVLFLIEMFGLCEGHWYLKRLNKMNKLRVALDRHKLHRVEEPSQETQKLKSKVRTEFKVFCLATNVLIYPERWCEDVIIIALRLEWVSLWAPFAPN